MSMALGVELVVGVVMTVDLFERLNRHAKIACSLPHVAPPLHEPRRRCVTKRVRDHVLAEPCCSPRGVPRPAQLADLAALVMTDEADAQLSVDPVPSAQVRQQPRRKARELTDAELSDLIVAVQSLIASGSAVAIAGGERTASEPH